MLEDELKLAVSKIFENSARIKVVRDGEFVEVIGEAHSIYPRNLDSMKILGYELFAFFEIFKGTYAAIFAKKEHHADETEKIRR